MFKFEIRNLLKMQAHKRRVRRVKVNFHKAIFMRSSASDSALNNGAQSQQKNQMFGVYKNEIYLIKTWMIVFAEMKTNEKRKSMRSFWVRKFYHENEKEREISETLLWIFTYSYNT